MDLDEYHTIWWGKLRDPNARRSFLQKSHAFVRGELPKSLCGKWDKPTQRSQYYWVRSPKFETSCRTCWRTLALTEPEKETA